MYPIEPSRRKGATYSFRSGILPESEFPDADYAASTFTADE